jgi:hypothetical protein
MTQNTPETRETLDRAGCGPANCNHDHSILHLHARCHMKAGLDVRYVKEGGVLKIDRKTCGKPVAAIQVAQGGKLE